jgi:transketolase
MGGICNGLYLYGGWRPFGATFLIFSDYMRGSMRLASLMGLPLVYVMTHDSVYLGEDGPTHQPVEHLSALRAIPGMRVLRPGDAEETAQAWMMALERTDGPTVLALTRQKLAVYEKADSNWKDTIRRGAYVVADSDGDPDVVVLATGSEVSMALEAAKESKKKVRVVSVLSRELLTADKAHLRSLVPANARVVVAESGVAQGWEHFVEDEADLFTINRFGASGPGSKVAEHLGFTKEALQKRLDA